MGKGNEGKMAVSKGDDRGFKKAVGGASHPHLVGHPQDRTIFHWVAVMGYSDNDNAAYIQYADSVHGSSVSWAGGVPAYSIMSYSTLATIFDGRGIIW